MFAFTRMHELATTGRLSISSALSSASSLHISPLAAVASELIGSKYQPVIPGANGTAGAIARGFHASTSIMGGRYTSQVPEKEKHWRANLSKKAKKRVKRQREVTIRRGKSMPQMVTTHLAKSALAVAEVKAMAVMPSNDELAERSRSNRTVIESVLLTEETPERVVDGLRRQDPAKLRAALSRSSTPDQWTQLLRVVGAQGSLTDVMAAYADMRAHGVAPVVQTLVALLTAAALQRNLAVAEEVWQSLTGRHEELARAATTINARTDASPGNQLVPARNQFVQPNTAAYGALIQAHVRAMDLHGAFRVLACAEAAGIDMADTVLWTHLIVGCVHAGEYERAVETFEHMRTWHALPDAVAYTTLITACGKVDQVERVIDLLTEMRQFGVQPTAVTYNAAIHAAGRSIRLNPHAHELFWEMDPLGLQRDTRTYHGVLLACSHAGDVARAREYISHMIGAGVKPDVYCLNTVLTVYARAVAITAKKPVSGTKNLAKQTPAETLAVARADGRDLPQLAEAGALSMNADEVQLAERTLDLDEDARTKAVNKRSRDLRHGSARRVLGDKVDLVDGMLADYFGAGDDHPSNRDKELEAIESNESPNSEVFDGPDSQDILNPADPTWLKLKSALLDTGIMPLGLLQDLEEEYSQRPATTDAEEAMRARKYEARHRARMERLEAEALDIAKQEAKKVGFTDTGTRRRTVGTLLQSDVSGSDSDGSDIDVLPKRQGAPMAGQVYNVEPSSDDGIVDTKTGPAGLGGVFSDVMGRAERVSGSTMLSAHVGRADLPSSSQLILDAARTGNRIPMREYLSALEREIMEASMGPEWGYESADEGDAMQAVQERAMLHADASRVREEGKDAMGMAGKHDEYPHEEVNGAPAIAVPTVASSNAFIPDVSSLPDAPTCMSPAAARTPEGKVHILRRRWVSMFGGSEDLSTESASLGGVRLRDLFDVNTIPLPPRLLKDIDKGERSGELDFAHLESMDIGSVYEHTEAVLRARVQAALLREAFGVRGAITAGSTSLRRGAKRLIDAIVTRRTIFEDPLMSDNAEEYAALAGVRLPGLNAASDSDGDGEQQEGENDVVDVDSLDPKSAMRREAAIGLYRMGVQFHSDGTAITPAPKRDVMESSPNIEVPFKVPAPGEEIVFGSALSVLQDAGAVRNRGLIEAQMADDPDGLSPLQRAHRSFTARVLTRVLAVHPVGPIETNLALAVEDADKRRLRLKTGAEPRLLDALFAVQKLKQQAKDASGRREVASVVHHPERPQHAKVVDANPAAMGSTSAADMGTSTSIGTENASSSRQASESTNMDDEEAMETASEIVRASPEVQLRVQARQDARQAEARSALVDAASSDTSAASRLKSLATMSDRLLGGAAWLPSGQYPADRGERRRVLLIELSRIYRKELPALGIKPDLVSLNVMVNAFAAAGDASSAYTFLHDEFPRAGVQPDVRTFRALIKMHVKRRETDRAVELLETMKGLGVMPDADCFGPVVHAHAREWRVRDAIAVVQAAKAAGWTCPEEYAKLLRARCKALGVIHLEVPEHPIGWQFRPEIMKKRFEGAKSRNIRRESIGLKPKLRSNMR